MVLSRVYVHRLEAVKAGFNVGKYHMSNAEQFENGLLESGIDSKYVIWLDENQTPENELFMATLDADNEYVSILIKGSLATV